MENYKNILEEIIEKEWNMFTNTKSVEGEKSSCQNDRATFVNARSAQWSSYPLDVLKSYLNDLNKAIKEKRNLVSEKYAYMMKDTDPEYFREIEHLLAPISEEKKLLIDTLVGNTLKAESEIRRNSPELLNDNRPLYSKDDSKYTTSVETYLRGEFSSYSCNTLEKILAFTGIDGSALKQQLETLNKK